MKTNVFSLSVFLSTIRPIKIHLPYQREAISAAFAAVGHTMRLAVFSECVKRCRYRALIGLDQATGFAGGT